MGGRAQKGARAAGSILTSGCCSNLPSNRKLLGNSRAGRRAGRSFLSLLIKAVGELGVWLSGIHGLVFTRPWLSFLGLPSPQNKTSQTYGHSDTVSGRACSSDRSKVSYQVPLHRSLQNTCPVAGTQGWRPRLFPVCYDPGAYGPSRPLCHRPCCSPTGSTRRPGYSSSFRSP